MDIDSLPSGARALVDANIFIYHTNPSVITSLTDYITEAEKLLRLPLRVTEVTAADITASHDLRRQYGLFVNDSINLACALRLGLVDIVTHDADFPRAPNIRVWEPTDI